MLPRCHGGGDDFDDAVMFDGEMAKAPVHGQRQFIDLAYPGRSKTWQALCRLNGRSFDRILIQNATGQCLHIGFDITAWMRFH